MARRREGDAVAGLIDRCGLRGDDVLIIHSAFAGLSRAGYRAEAFVEAWLEQLPDLTLLMPVMTWRTVTPESPVFDELATVSHTGVLAEVFRTGCATHRSIHPTHSAAAVGPMAESLTEGHQRGETPCPTHSPFGRLAQVDAGILLLGVGFECCTAIHCWEEEVAPDFYVRPREEAALYRCRDRHGTEHMVRARRHFRLDRNFNKFAPMLAARGQLEEGRLAATEWRFCRARDLRDVVLGCLADDPAATVG